MTEDRKKLMYKLLPIIGLGLVMAIFAGAFNEKIEPTTLGQNAQNESARTYAVKAIETEVIETIPGTLRAKQATILSSRLLAGVKTMHVRAGDYVEAGDLLVELDNEDLKSRHTMWQQQVLSHQARLQQVRPQYERIKQLFESGNSSQASLDKAAADYQSLLAQLASATASEQEALAALDFSQVTTPISGRIIDRLIEPGAMASPGMGLVSIYNPGSLRVELNVRESLALKLSVGDHLTAEIPSVGKIFTTTLEEIIPEAHVGSRSFLVKSSINVDPQLVPGLFVRVRIPVGVEERIFIPQEYIKEMGQLNIVWLKTDAGATKQIITIGDANEDGARLLVKGLQVGDTLVHPDDLEH